MKWTEFFIPTMKEVPAEASVPSHQLMLRAGMIRQVVAGAYTYLPLGYRTLRKIEAIVREEMNAAGAVELHMPALHPIEWWEKTGRVEAMGDVLLRLGGSGEDWRTRTVLGPTHEEIITEIARAHLRSYKQLPVSLYQIQTKFRGEARPKSGVLRTREFLMKDAYSFHQSLDGNGGLDSTYQRMYEAYRTTFSRCGLPYRIVEAESGPIGGDASHEFMVPTDAGEDVLVRCEECDYAANVERATFAPVRSGGEANSSGELQDVHTPDLRTVDEVCEFLERPSSSMIKTLIYSSANNENKSGKNEKPNYYMVLVRGDHEVNEAKLTRATGEPVELASEAGIREVTGANVGFAGPQGIGKKLSESVKLIVDQAVSVMHNAASGANKDDHHAVGIEPGVHFPLDGDNVTLSDVRSVASSDLCPQCEGNLVFEKCIEVGHVFKLGTKYSDAMDAVYLDANGKPQPLIMGCYGIGLNRIMAAAIEAFHDKNGISWPVAIAPYTVVICALDMRVEEVTSLAEKLHDELTEAGVDVLLDDRDARPGFKFKDAELIGFPIRLTVGKRGLADGIVECQNRRTGEVRKITPDQVAETVKQLAATMVQKERT